MGCIDGKHLALRAADLLLNVIVVLFLLTAGAYSAYALWDNAQVYRAVDDAQADLLQFRPRADGENTASFEELQAINPDVKGWITLDHTSIDYPVLQGENNFSYINTDVYGDFALTGSIFLDADCDAGFRDRYSLLYGHHMENGRMFGDLDLYKGENFFRENTTGTLILPDRTYHLEVFACLLVPASEEAIFEPGQWKENPAGLVSFVREQALHLHEETLDALCGTPDAQILAMSTCSAEFTDARTILLAWMKTPGSEKEGMK